MKGIAKCLAAVLTCTAAAAGGCYTYRDLVDPCYPQRYEYMARKEVNSAIAPQVQNGHVLEQTLWNYHFVPGTDQLTTGGMAHLAYLVRRRPQADPNVYVQTAQDVTYDAAHPDKYVTGRLELDTRRTQAVERYLAAYTGGPCAFQVHVHDPGEVGLGAIGVNTAIQRMYFRFQGGLRTGGGGTSGGGGAGGGGGGTGGAGASGAVATPNR